MESFVLCKRESTRGVVEAGNDQSNFEGKCVEEKAMILAHANILAAVAVKRVKVEERAAQSNHNTTSMRNC